MKRIIFLGFCVGCLVSLSAQTNNIPDIPVMSGYKGNPGVVTKYNSFNFLSLKEESSGKSRQSTGQYWEVNYSYDSAFRQKEKFAEFINRQVKEKGGAIFFEDTVSMHFAVPEDGGNIWGKVLLTSNSMYKLRLIKERAFNNTVIFDTTQNLRFAELVQPVDLPPRIGFLPNSVVTRAEQSKFNHYSFTYSDDKTGTFRQKLMGPYWDLKIEIQDENGEVDKRISFVEIQESYYRAAIKAGGEIVKNRAREIVFKIPGEGSDIWVRLMVTMDGIYFLKVIEQSLADFQEPELVYPKQVMDSTPGGEK